MSRKREGEQKETKTKDLKVRGAGGKECAGFYIVAGTVQVYVWLGGPLKKRKKTCLCELPQCKRDEREGTNEMPAKGTDGRGERGRR